MTTIITTNTSLSEFEPLLRWCENKLGRAGLRYSTWDVTCKLNDTSGSTDYWEFGDEEVALEFALRFK